MKCAGTCDHCYPEMFHPCVRPKRHRGYCSCVMQDEDYETEEAVLRETRGLLDGVPTTEELAEVIDQALSAVSP